MSRLHVRFSYIAASVLAALGAMGSDARAQAWVGEQGSLDLALDYNYARSTKVVFNSDFESPNAGVTTQQFMASAEYVPIQRLAVSVGLPLVLLKFRGDPVAGLHPGGSRYDDGDTHATLTDLRAGVRYQVLDDVVALSPHLAGTLPVADYETVGNAVGGRHLMALHAGLGVGTVIGAATYLHALYEFSLVEKYDATPVTEEIGQNRSDIALTIGHKLLDQRLDIHLDGNLRLAHGGINFVDFAMLDPDEERYHDALLKEDILLVGGGLGYQLSNSLALSLSVRAFVWGNNTQNASVGALGITWSPL